MEPYPRRDSHFAHRFVRVLHKSCAAQDIGTAACYLLCVIAHTEDAARYRGPARFWNSQLMETLGFTSPKQLDRARDAAMEAGWLHYDRAGNRQVGEYFVSIPEHLLSITDAPIEPSNHSHTGKNNGTIRGTKVKRKRERIGNGKRNESETESGKPPIPSPNPVPNPIPKYIPPSADDLFDEFWKVFPAGRKTAKGTARKAWKVAIKKCDPTDIIKAAIEYSQSKVADGEYVKMPSSWLNQECWQDDRMAWNRQEASNGKAGITTLPDGYVYDPMKGDK